jgi:hypothetical protein
VTPIRAIGGKNFHKRRGDAEDRSIASSRRARTAPATARSTAARLLAHCRNHCAAVVS